MEQKSRRDMNAQRNQYTANDTQSGVIGITRPVEKLKVGLESHCLPG